MTPNSSNDPGSNDSSTPRPPKTGEPWPKRFTFTPDGSMSFIKHGDDGRRGRAPRRFDGPGRGTGGSGGPDRRGPNPQGQGYGRRPDFNPQPRDQDRPRRYDSPNRGPGGWGGPSQRGPDRSEQGSRGQGYGQRPGFRSQPQDRDQPRRFDGPNRGPGGPDRRGPDSQNQGYGRRPEFSPHPRDQDRPRPWGPPRPGTPSSAGSIPAGRPFRPAGPRGSGAQNAGPWRPPGAPPQARPGYRPFPAEGAGDRPRRDWQSGSGQRTIRAGDRPVIQSNHRGNEPGSRAPRDDRPPSGQFGGGRPEFRPTSDRRGDRPRTGRPPIVDDRTTGRSRPWSGDSEPGRPVRRLPRPQSGLDSSPAFHPPQSEETPAGREQLAARIIARATANIPADLLLRQTLSRRKQLSRADGAWISRAVFACFRWQGWLDAGAMAEERIARALGLADDFAISAGAMTDDELVAKAIPAWTCDTLPVTPAWVRSLQAEPVLWLRTRRGQAADVAARLDHCEVASHPAFSDALRYDGQEDLFRHELFQAGAFEIQDIASQAVGILCAPQPGETWWDACAGEGGKTLHLSSLMEGKGLLWSSDRAEWRLTRLKQRAGRAGCFNYRSVTWNGGIKPPTKTRFDGVLVDAPCSGLGTWGRNPHARWTTTPDDIRELAVVQCDLLSNAATSVKPGGRLIYAVCTLTRAETTGVVDAFSAAHPEFEAMPLENPFQPGAEPVHPLCLWPQDTGGNGMFVAGWRRRGVDPAGESAPQAADPSSQPGIGSQSDGAEANPS